MLHNSSSESHPSSGYGYEAPRFPATGVQRLPAQEGSPLPSESLLRGQKIVAIVHNGSLYKLQATKLGKLILTK